MMMSREKTILNNLKLNQEKHINQLFNSNLSIERKFRILSKLQQNDKISSSIFDFIFNNANQDSLQEEKNEKEILLVLFKEDVIVKQKQLNSNSRLIQIINPRKNEIEIRSIKKKLSKKIHKEKHETKKQFNQQLGKIQEEFSTKLEEDRKEIKMMNEIFNAEKEEIKQDFNKKIGKLEAELSRKLEEDKIERRRLIEINNREKEEIKQQFNKKIDKLEAELSRKLEEEKIERRRVNEINNREKEEIKQQLEIQIKRNQEEISKEQENMRKQKEEFSRKINEQQYEMKNISDSNNVDKEKLRSEFIQKLKNNEDKMLNGMDNLREDVEWLMKQVRKVSSDVNNISTSKNSSLLHIAVMSKSREMAEALISKGADADSIGNIYQNLKKECLIIIFLIR